MTLSQGSREIQRAVASSLKFDLDKVSSLSLKEASLDAGDTSGRDASAIHA